MSRKRAWVMVVVVFIMGIAAIMLVETVEAASYKKGSSGNVVRQIQQVMKNQGYYTGRVDGVYDDTTEAAVKEFQQEKGLRSDGAADDETLRAMGIAASGASGAARGDIELLARLISAEARDEPYSGQVAVGAVALNRIEHPAFPNTLSGVVYQNGAFDCIASGQFNQPVAESAYQAARDAINGFDPSGGAVYYFNPSNTENLRLWSRPEIITIGKYRFCA